VIKKTNVGVLLTIIFTLATILVRGQEKYVSDSLIIRSLQTFVKLVDSQHLKDFRLKSMDELKSLKGGQQFKTYMIGLNDLKKYQQGDDVDQIIMEYPVVEVALVSATGRIVTSIQFLKDHGKWEASRYGLTPALGLLSGVQGMVEDSVIKKGKLIRIPTLGVNFIAVRSAGQLQFISLQDRPNLKLTKNQKLEASEAIWRLVPLASKQTGQFN